MLVSMPSPFLSIFGFVMTLTLWSHFAQNYRTIHNTSNSSQTTSCNLLWWQNGPRK